MSHDHSHGLDEYDDEALLRELLSRVKGRRAAIAEATPATPPLAPAAAALERMMAFAQPVVHLMDLDRGGMVECGAESPSRATPARENATCPECLRAARDRSRSNGASGRGAS
jgi:hypothetical protein